MSKRQKWFQAGLDLGYAQALEELESPRRATVAPKLAQRHSATSVAAARSMTQIAPTLRDRVLRFIESAGPVTDEEIAVTLGLNPSTARPRRIELVADGLVMAAPETRPTAAGRAATAWIAVHDSL